MRNLILCLCGLLLCCINASAENYNDTIYLDAKTRDSMPQNADQIYNADGTRNLYFLDDTVDVKLIIHSLCDGYNFAITDPSNLDKIDFRSMLSNSNVFLFDNYILMDLLPWFVKYEEWFKWDTGGRYLKSKRSLPNHPEYAIMEYAKNEQPKFYTSIMIRGYLFNEICFRYAGEGRRYSRPFYFPNENAFYRVVFPVWAKIKILYREEN